MANGPSRGCVARGREPRARTPIRSLSLAPSAHLRPSAGRPHSGCARRTNERCGHPRCTRPAQLHGCVAPPRNGCPTEPTGPTRRSMVLTRCTRWTARGWWGVQDRPGGKGGAIGDAGGFTCDEVKDSTRTGGWIHLARRGWIQPGRVDGFTWRGEGGFTNNERALDALLIFTGECKCGGLNNGWRAVRGARVPHTCPTCPTFWPPAPLIKPSGAGDWRKKSL